MPVSVSLHVCLMDVSIRMSLFVCLMDVSTCLSLSPHTPPYICLYISVGVCAYLSIDLNISVTALPSSPYVQ